MGVPVVRRRSVAQWSTPISRATVARRRLRHHRPCPCSITRCWFDRGEDMAGVPPVGSSILSGAILPSDVYAVPAVVLQDPPHTSTAVVRHRHSSQARLGLTHVVRSVFGQPALVGRCAATGHGDPWVTPPDAGRSPPAAQLLGVAPTDGNADRGVPQTMRRDAPSRPL